jgi:predicted enzyme related to lactoylglutathione lyase
MLVQAQPQLNGTTTSWFHSFSLSAAPFAADTDYFAADKQFMINLRVEDLDTLLTDLRRSGIEVLTDPSWDTPETGRFARVHGPEGNAVEIWEPAPG